MKKMMLGIIVGGIIFGCVGIYAVNNYLATDISYTTSDGIEKNVNEALNELYENNKVSNSNKKDSISGQIHVYGTDGNWLDNNGNGGNSNSKIYTVDLVVDGFNKLTSSYTATNSLCYSYGSVAYHYDGTTTSIGLTNTNYDISDIYLIRYKLSIAHKSYQMKINYTLSK